MPDVNINDPNNSEEILNSECIICLEVFGRNEFYQNNEVSQPIKILYCSSRSR
jgi:hypothetical protein